MLRLATVGLAAMLLWPATVGAQYPLFDAHIHYSRADWDAYTPERALSILARAGVRRALVSSTPDDGTLKLYEKSPAGKAVGMRLATAIRAIGEVHFGEADVTAPTLRRFAELAAARKILLWCHVDDATVERVLKTYPATKVLWAHAGMSASPGRVGELLARYSTLWVELAMRTDVAPGGALDPEWRALFVRHPDRFLVGTDTWVTSRWESVREASDTVQAWLRQLPREVAEQIAWQNGDRLFPPP